MLGALDGAVVANVAVDDLAGVDDAYAVVDGA